MDFKTFNQLQDKESFSEYLHVFWEKYNSKKLKFIKPYFLYEYVENNKESLKSEIVKLISLTGSIRVNNQYLFEYLSIDR